MSARFLYTTTPRSRAAMLHYLTLAAQAVEDGDQARAVAVIAEWNQSVRDAKAGSDEAR